jgi:hypothetical protein
MAMSKTAVIRVLIAALASTALACAQTSYPHAFPRKGAVKLFENDRVMVWDATWPIGVDQPIHQHKYDMAGLYLRYGQIKVTSLEGKVTIAPSFETPRPLYQGKGVTHKEEAVGGPGDPERHAIMVDIKEYAPPPFTLKPGIEPAFPREGAKDAIDNPRVRIWDYTWLPKKPVAQHVHDKDSVEVFVDAGTLLTKTIDGHEQSKTVAYGDARFVPRGQVDTEEAVGGSPRAFIIELK